MAANRVCNRCNTVKENNARCHKCGSPEFRIVLTSPIKKGKQASHARPK